MTSDPVSSNQGHLTFEICDHGRCGVNEALSVEFDTSGCLIALVLFSLNLVKDTDRQCVPHLHT